MAKYRVVAVKPLDSYKLHLQFKDGASGVVDIAQQVEFTGIFQPLQDLHYFRTVRIHPELGVICWENGADFDPIVLYCLATGQPLPTFGQESTPHPIPHPDP